jgi:hypothetical protein
VLDCARSGVSKSQTVAKSTAGVDCDNNGRSQPLWHSNTGRQLWRQPVTPQINFNGQPATAANTTHNTNTGTWRFVAVHTDSPTKSKVGTLGLPCPPKTCCACMRIYAGTPRALIRHAGAFTAVPGRGPGCTPFLIQMRLGMETHSVHALVGTCAGKPISSQAHKVASMTELGMCAQQRSSHARRSDVWLAATCRLTGWHRTLQHVL